MTGAEFVSAFTLGLLGSGHCLSMCGGVHGMLMLNTPQASNSELIVSSRANTNSSTNSSTKVSTNSSKQAGVAFLVPLFSLGRISSYALAGLVFGSVGYSLQSLGPRVAASAQLLAGVMLLAMALYTGRWWMGLAKLEFLGSSIWRYIQPATHSFIPPRSGSAAIALGALWGWIPCGLVYSVLAWAALAAGPEQAAARMFVFGLGTLPAMLTAGFAAHRLVNWLNKRTVRSAAALLLLGFALYTVFNALPVAFGDGDSAAHHHH